jgi:glycosyltransferase involved in cell wall biosynthesis/GT2 family glycosyltransferase
MPRLSASLVIVTLDRAASLDRTLTSLRQIRYDNFEVLVVVGPSRDATAQVLARHPGVRSYAAEVANISVSRNIGLAHARGDVVVFIDDDAVPEPDWLEALLAPYANPDVATVGGFIRDAGGFEFQARYVVSDRFGDVRHYADFADLPNDSEAFLSLTGTNFSARRDSLVAIGGFDEEYVWFLDETDVNLRMFDRGWRFAVAETAEIHHKSEAGVTRNRSPAPRTMLPQMRSKAYFCVRHNLGRKPLADILGYIADYVRKERGWKSDLIAHGADQATVDRLIAEVERGAQEGVADALRRPAPRALDLALIESARGDVFKRFALPRAAADRLRICLLTREYPPQGRGGVGQWTREVAVGLAARGHEVTVIALALEGERGLDFVEGVWVHRIDVEPISPQEESVFAPAPGSLTAASLALHREVRRIGARRRFDVIGGPIVDLAPMASCAWADVPVVVSLHTTYKLSLPFKPDWLSRPDYLATHVFPAIAAENRLIGEARYLLANSRTILDDIETEHGLRIDRSRATVVPHGVGDLAGEIAAPPRAPGVNLLFVGRLEPRKGADALLAILPDLLAAAPDLVVDIVGEDDIPVGEETLRRQFEAQHADLLARVRFHGAAPRETLLARYAASDIFIAPSQYESFGLVFIEAMCFGKPVVAFGVGGALEIVTDGETGLLAPPGDREALAACVLRLACDTALRERLGRRAREVYEQRYTTELMIDRLEAFYRGVVADRRRAAA